MGRKLHLNHHYNLIGICELTAAPPMLWNHLPQAGHSVAPFCSEVGFVFHLCTCGKHILALRHTSHVTACSVGWVTGLASWWVSSYSLQVARQLALEIAESMAVATGTAGTAMAVPHFYSINIMSDRQSRLCNISNLLRLLIVSQDQTRLWTIIVSQATPFNRK